MSRLVAGGLISVAAVLGVVIGTELPTAQAQKDTQPPTRGRYDARSQPVLGFLGGMLLEVTDHQTNTLYFYLAKAEWSTEKDAKDKEPKAEETVFDLVGKST